MASLNQKIFISKNSSLLFLLLNTKSSFQILSKIFKYNLLNSNNCPNSYGILINTIIFFFITYLSMGDPLKNQLFKLIKL